MMDEQSPITTEYILDGIWSLHRALIVESKRQFDEIARTPATISLDRAKALGAIVDATAPLEGLLDFISQNGTSEERTLAIARLGQLQIILVENVGFGLENPLLIQEELQKRRNATVAAREAAMRARNAPSDAEHELIVYEVAKKQELKRGSKYFGSARALAGHLKPAINERRVERGWEPVGESRISKYLKAFCEPKSDF